MLKRKEDKLNVQKALLLLQLECDRNKKCETCRLYKNYSCLLESPPAIYDIDEIIKCFT